MGNTLMRAALLLMLAILSGCDRFGEPADPDHAGTPAEAEDIARAWLAAVSDDSGDRGWSLLHPITRERLYGDNADRYEADVASVDWRQFQWELVRPAVWDGNYMLVISLPGGTAPAADLADGHLMQPIPFDSGEPHASITVRIDFDGSRGVLGP